MQEKRWKEAPALWPWFACDCSYLIALPRWQCHCNFAVAVVVIVFVFVAAMFDCIALLIFTSTDSFVSPLFLYYCFFLLHRLFKYWRRIGFGHFAYHRRVMWLYCSGQRRHHNFIAVVFMPHNYHNLLSPSIPYFLFTCNLIVFPRRRGTFSNNKLTGIAGCMSLCLIVFSWRRVVVTLFLVYSRLTLIDVLSSYSLFFIHRLFDCCR